MNILFILILPFIIPCTRTRSFTVDWENDRFLKDGEPFQFFSGGMHYFRVPSQYWADRMHKMKLAGMNTLQTYVAWNTHQPQEGQLVGLNIVVDYLILAQKMGLNVVLRPGPYICAEWSFGGFPYWLLNKPGIQFRVYNEPYIAAIADWFSILLPMMEPFLYKNGGPIIAVQVENEYGAYGACDKKYLQFLLDQYIKYFGEDVVYYTVDNKSVERLACGTLPGLLKTLDFGPDKIPLKQLAMLRKFQSHGPLVNTEFWVGWFDSWGDVHANKTAADVAKSLDQMVKLNASVNFYMFEGGTNFGYTNGALSYDGYEYSARPTSYDYDSPLTEAGDTTPKYWAIRKVMKNYIDLPLDPVPPHSPKWRSPTIQLTQAVSLFDNLDIFSQCQTTQLPVTMEQFNQSDGFILYKLQWSGVITTISLYDVHDRAAVYIGSQKVGVINRMETPNGTIIVPEELQNSCKEEVTISILVENMGRVNHGTKMGWDYKGITKTVLIDGVNVNSETWTVCPLPLTSVALTYRNILLSAQRSPASSSLARTFTPTFFCGKFTATNTDDTFLDPRGWGKGVAYLNQENLGRYWPGTGPQVTLYTPGVFFNKGINLVCLFEVDYAYNNQSVRFIGKPIIGIKKPDYL